MKATCRRVRAPLVVLEGAGHLPPARHPVKVNLLIREFVDQLAGRSTEGTSGSR